MKHNLTINEQERLMEIVYADAVALHRETALDTPAVPFGVDGTRTVLEYGFRTMVVLPALTNSGT